MKATLTVGSEVYDEFIQMPFKNCAGAVEAIVTFAPTDDPYFYDLSDRRRVRTTLFQEIEQEEGTGGSIGQNLGDPQGQESVDLALLPPWEDLKFQLDLLG